MKDGKRPNLCYMRATATPWQRLLLPAYVDIVEGLRCEAQRDVIICHHLKDPAPSTPCGGTTHRLNKAAL